MSRKYFPGASRATVIGLFGAAVLFCSTPGSGQSPRTSNATRRACANSYEKAQELRQASKLREAKEALQSCVKNSCGDFVQRECTKWLVQIDAEMPSMVLLAKDEAGLPILDVQVTMDGELLTSRLDGRAVSVDPGMHDFAFQTVSGAVVERRVPIMQGERNRLVSVEFPAAAATRGAKANTVAKPFAVKPAPASAPSRAEPVATRSEPSTSSAGLQLKAAPPDADVEPSKKNGSGALPWVIGGVGVIGAGGYALLYSMAKSENAALISQCWPTCSEDRLDRVRNLYLAADVSLGVGVAALGTATYLFLQSGSSSEKPAPQSASYVVDVAPAKGGVFASVSGVF
jgi:hypothetical protein